MMDRLSDPRYIRCEESLRQALQIMIDEKNLDEINISSLCKKAGIDRKTFYLHYKSVDELLSAILEELNETFISRIKYKDINNIRMLVKEYISYIENENLFFEKIVVNDNYSYVLSRNIRSFFDSVHDLYKPLSDVEEYRKKLIISFINNSFFVLYRQWIDDGKVIKADELIDIISELIKNGISSVTNG